jgi:hypothetical protein
MSYPFVKNIDQNEEFSVRFSICTLVSKPQEYKEMLDTFLSAGFSPEKCEYLCIDNSQSNKLDAYEGLNRFLRQAQGEYIILCHQDILLNNHTIIDLESRIQEMDVLDTNWGILSNAGGVNLKYVAKHMTQIVGSSSFETNLPLKAQSIDENFILVKNSANLALSHDLHGFHMYGTDICLIAETLGFNAYIIDFHLTHKSGGNVDKSFDRIRNELMIKYRQAFRNRFIATTITRLYLSGSHLEFWIFNSPPIMFLARQYYKFFKPKLRYQPGHKDK